MELILASGSPRRRELLKMLGLEFRVIPSESGENPPVGASPEETVKALAAAKALEVAGRSPAGSLVIGADTLVYLDGSPMGKPGDEAQAAKMLERLSGRTHTVYTGVALVRDGELIKEAEKTDVTFRVLRRREIETYIKTGEPMDKAGAYGIQGIGAIFVESIRGDYFNVMGLPLCRLGRMTERFGYSLLKENG